MSSSTELAIAPSPTSHGIDFFDVNQFAHAQRVAGVFANSMLAPQAFQGNIANCVIALDIAARTGSSPLAVMQNLNIIHGKPSWSSQYIIASLLACGRFTPLRYEMKDAGPIDLKGVKTNNKICVAYAWEKTIPISGQTRENRLESPEITCAMAIQEGWWSKNGSKWPVMTDLMLRYRAATLFGRMYAPDILMGMQAQEEVQDIIDVEPLPERGSLALENKLTEAAPSPRKKRGAAAAAGPTVDVEPAPAPAAPAPAEPEPAPTPAAAAPAEPIAQPAPAAEPAPAPAPESVTVRAVVRMAKELRLPDSRLICSIDLTGDDYSGTVYYEKPLVKFDAGDGDTIDAVLIRQPHKSKPGEFVTVLSSFTIVSSAAA